MAHRPILTVCLLLPLCLLAQSYQPFLPGRLHYFTAASNYSVRIDSVGMIGGDSVFWMNEIARPASPACIASNAAHFVTHQEGLFGDHFLRGADGAYRFVNRGGDTATFHTMRATNVPWSFVSGTALTAMITQRGLTSVFGQTDSVIAIAISDGRQCQLSQHHGLLSAPNLSYYLGTDSLRLSTLAELPSVPDFKDFFDWQPADYYVRAYTYDAMFSSFDRYDILDRWESSNGDSLILQAKHRFVGYRYNILDSLGPADTLDLVYARDDYHFLEWATYEPDIHAGFLGGYHAQQSWAYSATYPGRKALVLNSFPFAGVFDSCGYSYVFMTQPPCDVPIPNYYTSGLGETKRFDIVGSSPLGCLYGSTELACFAQAGHDSLAPCPVFEEVLPVHDAEANASLRVWRKAQTAEIGLQWEGLKPGRYQWQLYDLNGRILQNEEIVMDRNGSRTLTLPGSAGMYLVRVQAGAGGWAQTLRIAWF
jgi:hypothetical protein